MTDTAAATPAASLDLDAIQALLTHDHGLMNIRELGRLSVCSKEIIAIFDEALVWKEIFESSAQAGRKFEREGFSSHRLTSWNGEPGLLECFSDPDDAVIARAGYKRAAGCLRGKSCARCGKLAAKANPLTMTRVCKICADADESSFLITKSKAKEAFLLGEAVVKNLPTAPFASQTIGGKDCTSILLLISDVKDAAFAKYGGADGLAAEFARRKSAAVERYTKSQRTAKPQKKRPKIEKLAVRPAENLKQLRFFGGVLPIGTTFMRRDWRHSSKELVLMMTHPAKCRLCDRMSTVENIFMHERLDHGVDLQSHWVDGMVPQDIPVPAGISKPADVPGATEELVQVLSTASIAHTYVDDEAERKNCLISIDPAPSVPSPGDQEGNITISVDKYHVGLDSCHFGGLDICYQYGSGTVPIKLLHLGYGESSGQESETSEYHFDSVKDALGLVETSPAALLVMLMSLAMPLTEVCELVSEVIDAYCPHSRENMPTLHAMWDILKSD